MSEETLTNPMGMAYSLGKSVYKHMGATTDPTITFDNDPSVGWYLNNSGEMVFAAQGYDTIVQAPDRTEFLCPVVINEIDEEYAPLPLNHKGILFRKPNSDGLWWKTPTCEIDLTATSNNLASMHAQLDAAMNSAIMDPMLLSNGSEKAPTYSFVGSDNTGMYLKNDDVPLLIFSVNGLEALRMSHDAVRSYAPYEFIDTITESPSLPTIGKLYKKAGSDGLWWSTASGEINLADFTRIAANNKIASIIDETTQESVENKIMQGENVDLNTIQQKTDELEMNKDIIQVADEHGHVMILRNDTKPKQPEVVHDNMISNMFRAQSEGTSIAYGFKDVDNSGMYFDKENNKLCLSFNNVPTLTLRDVGASFNHRVLVNNYASNGRESPQYTFDEALDRGLYIGENSVGLSLYGGLNYIELARDKVIFNKDLFLQSGLDNTNGRLYVKDSALWWHTDNIADVCIINETVDNVKLDSGTCSEPSITFKADLDTGFYLSGANQVGIAACNKQLMTIDTYSATANVPYISASIGSAVDPNYGFAKISKTGLYYNEAATTMSIAFNGENMFSFSPQGTIAHNKIIMESCKNGKEQPQYAFNKTQDRGLYKDIDAVGLALYGGATYLELRKHEIAINKDVNMSGGVLTKRDANLWWICNNIEVCLTQNGQKDTTTANITLLTNRVSSLENTLSLSLENTNSKFITLENNLNANVENTNSKISSLENAVNTTLENTNHKIIDLENNLNANVENTNSKISSLENVVNVNLENINSKFITLENNLNANLEKIMTSNEYDLDFKNKVLSLEESVNQKIASINSMFHEGIKNVDAIIQNLSSDYTKNIGALSLTITDLTHANTTNISSLASLIEEKYTFVDNKIIELNDSIANANLQIKTNNDDLNCKISLLTSRTTSRMTDLFNQTNMKIDSSIAELMKCNELCIQNIAILGQTLENKISLQREYIDTQFLNFDQKFSNLPSNKVEFPINAPCDDDTPMYTFIHDPSSGMLSGALHTLTLMTAGIPAIFIDDDEVSINRYLRLKNKYEPDIKDDDLDGYLYKGDDSHLYWKTAVSMVNISGLANDVIKLKKEIDTDNEDIIKITDSVSKINDTLNHHILNSNVAIANVGNKFTLIDNKITDVDAKFMLIDNKFTDVDNKIIAFDNKIKESVDDKFTLVDNKIIAFDNKIKESVDDVALKMSDVIHATSNTLHTQIMQVKDEAYSEICNISSTVLQNSIANGSAIRQCKEELHNEIDLVKQELLDTSHESNAELSNLIGGAINGFATLQQRINQPYEVFQTYDATINAGSIMCLNSDGTVQKMIGCSWATYLDDKTPADRTSIMGALDRADNIAACPVDDNRSYYSKIEPLNNSQYLVLRTSEEQTTNISTLHLQVNCYSNEVMLSSNKIAINSVLNTSIHNLAHHVRIVKIWHDTITDTLRFIVAFGQVDDVINSVIFKKLKIELIDNKPIITIESSVVYKFDHPAEQFDVVYENTNDLDILILCAFIPAINNFESALIACKPNSADQLSVGYRNNNVLSDMIITNGMCNLRMLLIPGQIVVISYANYKSFLLLPSMHSASFSVGDLHINNGTSDCVSLVYDHESNIILSTEKTITNMVILQIIDINGSKINIVSSKIINTHMRPIGLCVMRQGYAALIYTNASLHLNFVICRYTDNDVDVQLSYCHDSMIIEENDYSAYSSMCWHDTLLMSMYNGLVTAKIPSEQLFIGIAVANAIDSHCSIAVRGNVYNSFIDISKYIGKNVYLNVNNVDNAWPANITDSSFGNLHIGLCIGKNKMLIKGI